MLGSEHACASCVPSPSPRSVYRCLGKYRLLELIGRGAMGDVYRAEHVLLGRKVAVKVLRAELSRNRELVERFFSEARAVNLVGHPHIVEVTDFARERDGTVWFVMEFLHGLDLGTLLQDETPSLSRALTIARQICDALEAVHAVGIVHRDIKPENVFLVQRDGHDFVKLLDFGIARLPELPDEEHTTLRGVVMGTPPYIAPEQARGMDVDGRCDVYAVGAVLFELISGRALFDQPDLRAMLADVAFTEPPALSAHAQVPSCVRAALDDLLARCLHKDPERRPATAKALGSELCAIAARLEAWTSQQAEAVAAEDGALLALCRRTWPVRAFGLAAAVAAAMAVIWLGPSSQAERPVTHAQADDRTQPPLAAASVASIVAARATPVHAAIVEPNAGPTRDRAPAISADVAAPARPARRHTSARAAIPVAAEPAAEAPASAAPASDALPALASAGEPRALDPDKLLNPFANE
jgi:eukaryotic-like serine/threonine-protein kinase